MSVMGFFVSNVPFARNGESRLFDKLLHADRLAHAPAWEVFLRSRTLHLLDELPAVGWMQ